MPRRAGYRTSLFEELERQLVFAPVETTRRQMESAETLAHETETTAAYPFEFVVWRLTGFRPAEAPPKPIDGASLTSDLATFVLHCSERVPMAADSRSGGAVPLGDLAKELGIVEKTLRRWRARGLLCHRVRLADGRSRVAVFRSNFDLFAKRHPEIVGEALQFSRLDPDTARAAMAQARTLVAEGLTANLAAKRVAETIGRSHETVRQLLQRTLGGERGTTLAGQLRSADPELRDREIAYRAWRFGVPVERIAERTKTKPDAARRRIDTVRAERLRGLRLHWIEFATFERSDAETTILGAPAVQRDLAPRFEPPEAIALLEAAAQETAPTPSVLAAEEAMLAAYNLLKRRAKMGIDALQRSPDRGALDRVETDLRWALRLKRRLAERWIATAVARVQQSLGGALTRRPADEIRRLLDACMTVISETIETVDPSRRQSPRRIVALETDRALARMTTGLRRDRAAARHVSGAVMLHGFFDRRTPWQDLLDVVRPRHAVGRDDQRLLARRHGWDGSPPRTLEDLAATEHTTVARLTKRLADAERLTRRGPT